MRWAASSLMVGALVFSTAPPAVSGNDTTDIFTGSGRFCFLLQTEVTGAMFSYELAGGVAAAAAKAEDTAKYQDAKRWKSAVLRDDLLPALTAWKELCNMHNDP